MSRVLCRPGAHVLAAVSFLGLSACSGDVNPVRDAVVATGLAGQTKEAQDFVKRSRPANLEYMPVGVSAAPRNVTKKSPDQIKALETELDTVRTGNEAKAAEARRAGAASAPAAPNPVR